MADDNSSDNIAPSEDESESSDESSLGGLLNIKLPACEIILQEVRLLASDRTFRVHDLATCIEQDPSLVLELLRISNSLYFIQGRPAITTAEAAIVHLGSKQLIEVVDTLGSRRPFREPNVQKAFEKLRQKAQKIAAIARILALATNKDLADEIQTIGLMSLIGEMMACAHLGLSYVELAENVTQTSLIYKLTHTFNFDTRLMQLAFLRRNGFPEVLLFALDRDAIAKTPHRAGLRYMLQSSIELVEAFSAGKIYRYEPGQTLPPKSSLRLLQLTDSQYKAIWERCYPTLAFAQTKRTTPLLDTESPNQLDESTEAIEEQAVQDEVTDSTNDLTSAPADSNTTEANTDIPSNNQSNEMLEKQPRVHTPSPQKSTSNNPNFEHPFAPELPAITFLKSENLDINNSSDYVRCNSKLSNTIGEFSKICDSAQDTIQLLDMLLSFLVTDGPFIRAALFIHSPDRSSAEIFRSVGGDFNKKLSLKASDPLAAIATCFTQVKSFNTNDDKDTNSPLGISSYALSPLDVKHDVPVSLYADCGNKASITFEARRVFRYIVGLLNSKLPEMEGTITAGVEPLNNASV